MRNTGNYEIARLYTEIQDILHLLRDANNIETDSVGTITFPLDAMTDAVETLKTIETRLQNLLTGDCQFPVHLIRTRAQRSPKVIDLANFRGRPIVKKETPTKGTHRA